MLIWAAASLRGPQKASRSCGLQGLLADKIEAITAAFEELIAAHGGAEHEGEARLSVAPFLNHSPYLCTLLDDPRIDGIARKPPLEGNLGFGFLNIPSDNRASRRRRRDPGCFRRFQARAIV